MSIEAIKGIRDAEILADEKIKSAQQQAKEIILKAEETTEKIIKEAIDSQLAKNKKLLEEAETKAIKEADKKRQLNKSQCDALREKASGKFEAAVKMVMERIVK